MKKFISLLIFVVLISACTGTPDITTETGEGPAVTQKLTGPQPGKPLVLEHPTEVTQISWLDNKKIYTVDRAGSLRMWDIFSPSEPEKIKIVDSEKYFSTEIHTAALSPDRKSFMTNDFVRKSFDGASGGLWTAKYSYLEIIDTTTWDVVKEVPREPPKGDEPFYAPINPVWSSDGKKIAAATMENFTYVFVIDSGEVKKLGTKSVRSVSWSPDNKRIVTGTGDGEIIVLDYETGTELKRINFETKKPEVKTEFGFFIESVAFSPDGKSFAATASDGAVVIYDSASYAEKKRIHESGVYWVPKISWSPDNSKILGSGVIYHDEDSKEINIYIWNANSGSLVKKFPNAHGQDIKDINWSPDGKYIASASQDETAKIWVV